MFRLIRLILFVAAAFVAGVLYERINATSLCEENGGEMTKGLCIGASK